MQSERTKRCSRCREAKPLAAFGKSAYAKDGLQYSCRDCRREITGRSREKTPTYHRDYYERTRHETLARQKARRDADIDNFRALARARYQDAPEAQRARSRRWAAENAEQARATVRAWHRAHPERARALGRKAEATRRARKLGAHVEDVDPRLVFDRDDGLCGICGDPVDPTDWHMDHVVPLALGGPHSYENVQVAHPVCNIRKGARTMNGLDTVEQRKAHVRALVAEKQDCNTSLKLAKERRAKIPDGKLVEIAKQDVRVKHLEDRIAAIDEQLQAAGGSGRTPRQRAEQRAADDAAKAKAEAEKKAGDAEAERKAKEEADAKGDDLPEGVTETSPGWYLLADGETKVHGREALAAALK